MMNESDEFILVHSNRKSGSSGRQIINPSRALAHGGHFRGDLVRSSARSIFGRGGYNKSEMYRVNSPLDESTQRKSMSLKVGEQIDGGQEDVVTRLPRGGHQSHGSEKVHSQDLAEAKNDVNQPALSPEKSRTPIQVLNEQAPRKSEIGDSNSVQLKGSSKDEEASISVTSGLQHNLSTTLGFKEQAQAYKGEASEEDTFVDAKDDQGVGFIFPDSSSMTIEVVSHTSSKVKAPTSRKGKRFMPKVDFMDTDSQRMEKKRSRAELIGEEPGNSHSAEEAKVGRPTKSFGMG